MTLRDPADSARTLASVSGRNALRDPCFPMRKHFVAQLQHAARFEGQILWF